MGGIRACTLTLMLAGGKGRDAAAWDRSIHYLHVMPRRFSYAPSVATLIAACITVASSGCGKSPRQQDCAKILPVVRDDSEKLRNVLSAASPDPTVMEAKAQAIEAAGRDLAAVAITDEGLKDNVAHYQVQLTKGAKLARDLGAVKPSETIETSGAMLQAEGAAFIVDEARLLSEIGEYCR